MPRNGCTHGLKAKEQKVLVIVLKVKHAGP